jgi:AT-rich interactive domain-containing protein 1
MSLKSGLLAESTWAIDALNILLYDDNTIAYFNLKHFPGLLNILIEHFLKCLKLIFNENNGNEFNDLFLNDYDYLLNEQDDDYNLNDVVVEEKDEELQEEEYLTNGDINGDYKLNNGYHHHSNDNDESSSSCSSTSISLKKKKLTTITNDNKLNVMKINFNDKITKKRFLHYYKSVKYNDSKCCKESFDYHTNIVSKYQTKTNNNNNCKLIKKKDELNNFIMTSFNTNDNDLDTLNKMFYGTKFYEQKKELQKLSKINNNNNNEIKHNKNKKIKLDEQNNINSKFIKLHQYNNNNNNNNRKYYDEQAITNDEEQLFKINNEYNIELINRCTSISTIIRNLSFVPGNDIELCKNNILLKILSRLLVFKHKHKLIINNNNNKNSDETSTTNDIIDNNDDEEEEEDDQELNCIQELIKKNLFYDSNNSIINDESYSKWSECVQLLRENTLVTIANISATINLNNLDEDVIELYSHGLLHWSICKSNDAQDALITTSETGLLSAQRLAIESLSKMTINEINIDLILTTMNKMQSYIDSFISILCNEYLTKREDETNREFSIVLLTSLAKCDQFAARSIAKYTSILISFIEDFEENARINRLIYTNLQYQQQFESNINEENLGTTIDMLRRCSNCLLYLASYTENIPYIIKHENRLLDLITSPFIDFKLCQTLTEVLYLCSSVYFNTKTNSNNSFKYAFLDPTVKIKLK